MKHQTTAEPHDEAGTDMDVAECSRSALIVGAGLADCGLARLPLYGEVDLSEDTGRLAGGAVEYGPFEAGQIMRWIEIRFWALAVEKVSDEKATNSSIFTGRPPGVKPNVGRVRNGLHGRQPDCADLAFFGLWD